MDTYLRLGQTISDLLSFLDIKIGEGNYLLFLTSDHGAVETPSFIKKNNSIIGELNTRSFYDSLKLFAVKKFGSEKIIANFSNRQIYFDRNYIEEKNLELDDVELSFVNFLRDNFNSIQSIMTRTDLEKMIGGRITQNTLLNGWNPSRSGEIIFNLKPNYLNNYLHAGTTHGSAYSYDTHIPLIF